MSKTAQHYKRNKTANSVNNQPTCPFTLRAVTPPGLLSIDEIVYVTPRATRASASSRMYSMVLVMSVWVLHNIHTTTGMPT